MQVERLLADQGEQLAAGWRAAHDAAQADVTRRDAEVRQLQAQCDALQKGAEQLKVRLPVGGCLWESHPRLNAA